MRSTQREIIVEESFSSDGQGERRQKFLGGLACAFCRTESGEAVEYALKKVEMSGQL